MPVSASATTPYYDRDSDLDDDDWLGTGDDAGWIDEIQPRPRIGYGRPARRPVPRPYTRQSRPAQALDEPEIVFVPASRRPERSQVSVRLAVALAAPLAIAVAAFSISSLAGGNQAATTPAASDTSPVVASPTPTTTTPQTEQPSQLTPPVATTPAAAAEPEPAPAATDPVIVEPAPTPTPEPAPLPDLPTVTLPAEGRLEAGDRGEEVTLLQQALVLLDASAITGEPDGIFGPETEAAVKAFQTAAGIASDGVAGPQTIAMLNEAVSKTRLVG